MNRSHLLKARRLQSNVLILLRDLLYNIFEKVNGTIEHKKWECLIKLYL